MAITKKSAPALPDAFPVLYARTKLGKLQQWRIWVGGVENDTIFTEFGQTGGKLQTTVGKKCAAMNTGKANERTADVQAMSVATSMHKFKLDRKYTTNPDLATAAKSDAPMLAQRYDQRAKHIKFPCDAQPKLDGNRGAARWVGGKFLLVSRSGVDDYELPHITAFLAKLMPPGFEFELDGELYVHGVSPQRINSWVSKAHPESANIEYHVYDAPAANGCLDDNEWSDRRDILEDFFANNVHEDAPIKLVPTVTIASADQIQAQLDEWLEAGYEGMMLRNHAGRYAWGDRTDDLQKVKVFEDAEFKVVGCKEGVGKAAGRPVFKVEYAPGKFVDAAVKAEDSVRREMWTNRAKYIGQTATIRFFGRFESGALRFPRLIKFRSAKDL